MVGTRSRGTPRAEASEVNGQAKKAVGAAPGTFSHTPTLLTLAWLIVSVSLVTWDTGYVLLRPLSMPGGSLHWPLWVPYDLYGRIDYIYGWKAFDERDGFTAAQSWLNVVESLMYAFYVITYFRKGVGDGKVKTLYGRPAAFALLVGYAAAVATLSKTALYWLQEIFSGYQNIGHNDPVTLLFLWIIPNGLWLIFPSYMIYVFGSDILNGLAKVPAKSD